MAEVVFDKVSKAYPNGTLAVRDLSLRVAAGELVVLLGPSGCGKTTTLRLLAGLERPTGGSISIEGRDVTGAPPHQRDVAFVFQRPALYPHLSVADNLCFAERARRWAPWGWRNDSALDARLAEVARSLGLGELLRRKPAELSGGQQQRVALGRALMREPAVFLLDEPFSGLDPPLRLEMRRELHLLQRSIRATMIHVTHDQEEAVALADRALVLDRGVVQQLDRPEALLQRPANRFVAGFLGWPPMALLDGALIEEEGRLALRAGPGGPLLDVNGRADWRPFLGQAVTVGIRPEQVRLGGRLEEEGRLFMEVRLVERTGLLDQVSLHCGPWSITARIESGGEGLSGSARAQVGLDLLQAHLFERSTGRALAHGWGPR